MKSPFEMIPASLGDNRKLEKKNIHRKTYLSIQFDPLRFIFIKSTLPKTKVAPENR